MRNSFDRDSLELKLSKKHYSKKVHSVQNWRNSLEQRLIEKFEPKFKIIVSTTLDRNNPAENRNRGIFDRLEMKLGEKDRLEAEAAEKH